MSRRPRPSYANVMSTVAVVLALTTSGAYAAGIGKNGIKAKHIASDAVRVRHIAANAVQGNDIDTGVIGARAIGDGSVGAAELADNSVGAGELANDSVGSGELAANSVGSGELANDSVGSSELADNSVGDSEIGADTVGSSEIENGSIAGEDVAPDAISSTRMTTGVRRLLFDAGTLPVNQTFGDVTVDNDNWAGGAPNSGADLTSTWEQPADGLDVVTGFARLEYPSGCSNTTSTPRGLDVKIVDANGRVISASAADYTSGESYNGNGFWAEQAVLPGVTFRAPNSGVPEAYVDYIHLPFEMAEFVTGGSAATRTVRVYFKRSSTACTPVVTGARIVVYRYADES
jgi:hypothetical protein